MLSWGSWESLLKVDILNIMGLSFAITALLWRAGATAGRQRRAALAAFSVFMLACSIAKDRAVAWWRTRRPAGPLLSTVRY